MEFVPRFWFLTNFKKPTEQGLSKNFMKTLFKKSFVLFLILTAFSCSEDGATGATGQAGADGNANVIGTNTVTTTSSNWTSYASGALWVTTLNVSGITQSILDRGIVCVFKSDSSGTWTALPFTLGNQSWFYSFGVGFVNINTTNTNITSFANPASQTFRVVIISASNRIANPNVNWNNYKEVKDALKLKD